MLANIDDLEDKLIEFARDKDVDRPKHDVGAPLN